ncbi:MAG: aminotransferase class I/II-fold pyridoxal phosphate-dependent enzyme [Deltaproteobacteria bacterium]|jgi:8-amino-7-oxononanoate synthase|nr:aminotransferase class I/II-fold pyridoxal phosphate-dependent enzyme [Deltaproteobacteria bacterium]
MSKPDSGFKVSSQIIKRMLGRKIQADRDADERVLSAHGRGQGSSGLSFNDHPAYETIRLLKAGADRHGIANPFFKIHEGVPGPVTRIGGKEYLNFSHYNYLGLAGHPEVNAAAVKAIETYSTSVSSSRLVSGERPVQRQLEKALAQLYGVDDCVVFVSGHATNIATISTLFGPKDLVVHDSLVHNSILEGIKLSGATRRSFPHNDHSALDALLGELRPRFERALVVVEGLYSMDGDIPDLPALVAIKKRHRAFLMVDEVHALGVLGASGGGIWEHYGLPGTDVDIWMGAFSKTLASCGGYIAGSSALVDILKYAAPGFVYSVGISPPLAAASLEALRIMAREPERVSRLRERGQLFLRLAREAGLNVGTSRGFSVVPVILGSSRKAVTLSNRLFENGINVQPIMHPAVEEKAARLRFFFSSEHSEQSIRDACGALIQLAR